LNAKDYDKAITLYSAAIDLDAASGPVFVKRGKANLEKELWDDALLDAQKVQEHLLFVSRCSFL
jgi:tetratricopeptide (TPR) repeat protein